MVHTMALHLSDGTIDLRAGCVRRGCGEFRLTARERDLLCYLELRSHRVVPRDELMREVWEYSDGARSRAVDFTVHRLRTKIEVDPTEPRHLLTVHGVGYQLVPAEPETTEVPSGRVALVAVALAARPTDESEAGLLVSERVLALSAEHGGHAARADGRQWLMAFTDPTAAIRVARALVEPDGLGASLSVAVCCGTPRCVKEPVSGRWDYRGEAVARVHALLETAPPGGVVVDRLMQGAVALPRRVRRSHGRDGSSEPPSPFRRGA